MAHGKNTKPAAQAVGAVAEPPFPSTTFGWRRVKVGRPAGGQQARRAQRGRFYGLTRRDPRQPLAMTVKLRGGAECWVEIHSRGRIVRYPGCTQIIDILREAAQDR